MKFPRSRGNRIRCPRSRPPAPGQERKASLRKPRRVSEIAWEPRNPGCGDEPAIYRPRWRTTLKTKPILRAVLRVSSCRRQSVRSAISVARAAGMPSVPSGGRPGLRPRRSRIATAPFRRAKPLGASNRAAPGPTNEPTAKKRSILPLRNRRAAPVPGRAERPPRPPPRPRPTLRSPKPGRRADAVSEAHGEADPAVELAVAAVARRARRRGPPRRRERPALPPCSAKPGDAPGPRSLSASERLQGDAAGRGLLGRAARQAARRTGGTGCRRRPSGVLSRRRL